MNSLTPVARRYDTVSLLTDYGTDDEFVGVLKAVIRDLAPHATTIDLTHGIRPFDVRAGSLALARAISYVPEGVVVAVVDPGVGTRRLAIAVEVAAGAGVLVGPDNGLLAPAVAVLGGATRAVQLTNTDYQLATPGATFAGRDVFAPAAAHLCNGVDVAELGPPIDPATLLPGTVPLPRVEDDGLHAEVLWVDRFGNLQLNVSEDDVDTMGDRISLQFRDKVRTAQRAATYGDIKPGAVGVVVDSYGLISICLDRHSAAAELGLGPSDEVILSEPSDDVGVSVPVTLR